MDQNSRLKLLLTNSRIISGSFVNITEDFIELENACFEDDPLFKFSIKFEVCQIQSTIFEPETPLTTIESYDDVQSEARKQKEEEYQGKSIELGNIPHDYNQIKENKKKFNIEFNYQEKDYTNEMDRESEYWKNNIDQAKEIERDILMNKRERNEDESKYSDVIRRKGKMVSKHLKKDESRGTGKVGYKKGTEILKIMKEAPEVRRNEIEIGNIKEKLKISRFKDEKTNIGRIKEDRTNIGRSKEEKINTYSSTKNLEEKIENVKITDQKAGDVKAKEEFSWSNVHLTTNENISSVETKVETKVSKRITFGKPTQHKFGSLNEMVISMLKGFTGGKDMKRKWSEGSDSFLNYKEEPRSYGYRK